MTKTDEPTPLQMATTDELLRELCARSEGCIAFALRTDERGKSFGHHAVKGKPFLLGIMSEELRRIILDQFPT